MKTETKRRSLKEDTISKTSLGETSIDSLAVEHWNEFETDTTNWEETYPVPERTPIDTLKFSLNLSPKGNYDQIRLRIQAERDRFHQAYDSLQSDSLRAMVIDSAKTFLEEAIINEVLPHWYGTPWSFEGHTGKPNDGSVACGYLVSTVLNHAGFKLNRFRFAQQYALIGAKSLQTDKPIWNYSRKPIADIVELLLKTHEDGLYKAGLDMHTGFILIRKGEVFFIHSNYINYEGVVIERALESEILLGNSAFLFSEITSNDSLMTRWVRGDTIPVLK